LTDACANLTWDDIVAGDTHEARFEISQNDMAQFAALSGDHNPVHQDAAFASQQGFDGCVVYGGLIVARISRMLGMVLPGRFGLWTGLNIQFRKPLYVDESALLTLAVENKSEAAKMLKLKIRVTTDRGLIASAVCESVFMG
jgi:3-hydroxybutyryl-CoA dehydratase